MNTFKLESHETVRRFRTLSLGRKVKKKFCFKRGHQYFNSLKAADLDQKL